VRLDGRDVRAVPLADLRAQVAVLPQEPVLFPRTVAENIAYGRPGATRAEVEAAARAAGAHAVVDQLSDGYDTVLGAGGATLSGGERQRLALARALLRDAPVLVLDEPTSALDPAGERLALAGIARLAAGRTTLLIAHRRSTAAGADRVVVLAGGRVVEAGPPAELLARGGAYARLLDASPGPLLDGGPPATRPTRTRPPRTRPTPSARRRPVAEPRADARAPYAWLARYGLRHRAGLAAVAATTLLEVGVSVARPWPLQVVVDHVLGGRPVRAPLARVLQALPGASTREGLLGWSVGAMLGVFAAGWALGLAGGLAQAGFGQRMVYDVAADLFDRLQRRSLLSHARGSVGDAIRRVTADAGCAAVLVRDVLLPVLTAVCTLAAVFVVMWRLDAALTLLALGVVPPLALVLRRLAGPLLEASYAHQEAEGRTYGVVEETLSAVRTVQAFGQEAREEARFAASTDAVLGTTLRLTDVQLQYKILLGVVTAAGTAAVLYVGARHTLAGRLTLGTTLVFLAYLASLYAPVETLMYASSTAQDAAGSARRVVEVLESAPEVADRPGAVPLAGRPRGALTFQAITAGYERERPVLEDVSLAIAPGELVALVGASGAGKSTLAALVPRFLDPWTGAVLLDGRDVRELPLADLRAHVALVLQQPVLFPRSVAENIAYGRRTATRAEIEDAARAANAHGFITRLPAGYDTVLGAGGATLSGGERQRLSIARALLKDAPVLVLDEPTSALDPAGERQVLEAVRRLALGRTTLLIAHRRSTVEQADRVVVLAGGRVVEMGAPAELLARDGAYRRLLASTSDDDLLDRS
jgi:ABC-type multidrug transport system fused ATPase/permease subunit